MKQDRFVWRIVKDRLATRLLRCGRTVWLEWRGVLTWRTAAQFHRGVAKGLTTPCRRIVMDLTAVEYAGGDILLALLGWHEQLEAAGVELRLVVAPGGRCAQALALTGLDRVIPTFTRCRLAWGAA
jgi:anti-anti-sigma factor